MNIVVSFEPTSLTALADLRQQYLSGLRFAQELMLEVQVPFAKCYSIVHRGQGVGYLLENPESHEAIEFHLLANYWVFEWNVLAQAIRALGVRSALVKSFDDLFVAAAMDNQIRVEPVGLLVRDFVRRELPVLPGLHYSMRPAAPDDAGLMLRVEQDVFTSPTRLAMVIERGFAHLFFTAETQLIGFGILRPVTPDGPDIDIGIAVDTPFRNKGYAVYMMRDMVDLCFSRGLNPVAGCARQNLASRRMGERVGLVARHRLLRMYFE